ncbi:3'-5' exonuclease [Vibrio cholerae]|uniref:3'-5' exonuclease n=1 Tax=Vibrio cholerae TaxID=666 RepID=UPI0011F2360E|nr:3'-5' exonuclease [Vibrio cholerae]KAA1203504.1 exonuclease domain-containing protein [Vibrio cholerae]GIA50477.1 putative 3'-5' EXONUCLEASE ERI1 [Vibrio cholerae]
MDKDNSIIIVDLEATCDEDERLISRTKMEIIEIGAVKVRLHDFELVDKYQSFVRPMRNPILTDFCTNLTGITQQDVSSARTFYEVSEEFFNWCWKDCNALAWCSWAMYDYYQLEQDCEHYFVDNELLCVEHLNLKNMYGDVYKGKRRGLINALSEQGLDFEGSNHRALDDALNAFKIVYNMPNFKREILRRVS